jgi:hypothetical protein
VFIKREREDGIESIEKQLAIRLVKLEMKGHQVPEETPYHSPKSEIQGKEENR